MPDKIRRKFADFAIYSQTDKTAISVRDGVLEYLGVELDLEPADKVFTIYRSPATIANAAYAMAGIPLTDDHVSMEGAPIETGSTVTESSVIDQIDENTHSRLAVLNKLSVSDSMSIMLDAKRQLSLGYHADLIPHQRWDFEQIDIIPHHLAAVEAGRCGELCSFLDRKFTPKPLEGKTMKLNKAFIDAEGSVSLEQIVEIAAGLPEAIRKVPVDKLQELMPAMQEIMTYAKDQGVMTEDMDMPEDEMSDGYMKDEDKEGEEMKDEDMKDEDKPKFSDSDFRKKLKSEKNKFADAEVKRYSEVVTKARNFLDDTYDFDGKTANDLMSDSLATQSTDKFADSELAIAFKLLRKADTDYTKFGDSQPIGALTARINADLEGK
jgi:hypothetical protein